MTEAVSPAQWNGQPAVRPEINALPDKLSRALAATPYLFGGEHGVMTDPTGLVHMRARYYHPDLRRFVNPDPIGFAGGMNGYGYAAGSPVMMVDPSGFATAQDHFELYDWAGIFGGGTSNDFVMPQQSDVAQMQAYEAEIRREQTAQKMIDFAITAVDLAMLAAAVAEPSPGGEVAYAGLRGTLRASAANATVRAESSLPGQLLRQDLLRQEAASAFTATGELSPGAISGSKVIIPAGQLGNPNIPAGFSKMSTRTFQSPAGDFQVHYYQNTGTGVIDHSLDCKIKFN